MVGALEVFAASGDGALVPASVRKAAIASRSLRRWPTTDTPRSFRSSAVRFGRTVSSISLSRKAASYCPRPRLRSQTTISMTSTQTQGDRIIVLPGEGVPGLASVHCAEISRTTHIARGRPIDLTHLVALAALQRLLVLTLRPSLSNRS